MAVCQHCGEEFRAERSTAKFCKPAHRVAYHRAVDSSNEVFNKMLEMPVAHLEAIYNNCARKAHNDIDVAQNRQIMAIVDTVCGIRDIRITGFIGSFEMRS